MDQADYKESLLKKRAEILSEGGGKPLQTSMDNNARQGDLADKASGNNEVQRPAENQADRRQDPPGHRGGALADGAGHLRDLPRLR